MDMVGHDHVRTDQPIFYFSPIGGQQSLGGLIGEDRLAIFGADRHELDFGRMVTESRRTVVRSFSLHGYILANQYPEGTTGRAPPGWIEFTLFH
jgi:hypothetical protein